MGKVLDGIRVLDFSRYGAGPICGLLLSDVGAEVIRVERPGGDREERTVGPLTPQGNGLLYSSLARGKKNMTLNLRSSRAEQILAQLVGNADVVIHNFPPRIFEASLFGYDRLKAMKPDIILVAISAFGQEGPYAEWRGFDKIAQAMCGSMSINGFPGNPPTNAQVPWVDWLTGSLSALGVMFALYHRERTGEGQWIDMSLLTCSLFLATTNTVPDYEVNGVVREQMGNQTWPTLTNTFKARDGWMYLSASVPNIWKRVAKTIGREDLGNLSELVDSRALYDYRHILYPPLEEWVANRTVKEAVDILQANSVPCGPIYDVAQVVNDPHVKAQGLLVPGQATDGTPMSMAPFPIGLSATPGSVEGKAPPPGEHNREIYCDLLGLAPKEFSELVREGIM
jgi:crotonobetainyl-CoA:carnitine CoA-transferase CaiB-like acyl-CoA transferase